MTPRLATSTHTHSNRHVKTFLASLVTRYAQTRTHTSSRPEPPAATEQAAAARSKVEVAAMAPQFMMSAWFSRGRSGNWLAGQQVLGHILYLGEWYTVLRVTTTGSERVACE